MKQITVIGAGFSGLAAATVLAHQGHAVTVFERNENPGGRARRLQTEGFSFDMGPSWYWMPDVFESYFGLFGKQVSEFYELKLLDPAYAIFFGRNDVMPIPNARDDLVSLFESYEPGSGKRLERFLREAAYKYNVGMQELVYKPGQSLTEFANGRFLKGLLKLHVFTSFHSYVRKYFRNPKLIQLMEFPVLFLGGMPKNTPALYSLMNYAGLCLGTWYPVGGLHKIVDGMVTLAKSVGVKFETGAAISEIIVRDSQAWGVRCNGALQQADAIVAAADYAHVEQKLLPEDYRTYDEQYWNSRVMAPSSLVFYLGVNKKLKHLHHHNLFFDEDFAAHAKEIYDAPAWPSKPLFYVCCPSKTDASVAPEGMENLFVLVPIAAGLKDDESIREIYFDRVMSRLEKITHQQIRNHIMFKRTYSVNDFRRDYNAFKGNAYGLANTLKQTALLKPSLRSKKVRNLFFCGQLTVPGPGVPPSLISGQIAAQEALKYLNGPR